jgi:GT2 family glycosyltransferase
VFLGLYEDIPVLDGENLLHPLISAFARVDLTSAAVPDDRMPRIFEDLIRLSFEVAEPPSAVGFVAPEVVRLIMNLLTSPQIDDDRLPDQVPADPRLSVVILSHNRIDRLLLVLQSVVDQRGPAAEIILVDNASTDGTPALVRNAFPSVTIIENSVNVGTATARNQGLRLSTSPYILLLDDDCVLEGRDVASSIFRHFAVDEICGAIALRIVDPDTGSSWPYIPSRGPDLPGIYLCGVFYTGAVALRRAALLDTGFFWEPYFISHVDQDLSLRMLRSSWHIVRRSDLLAWHPAPGQGPVDLKRVFYFQIRNRIWFALRNLPLRLFPVLVFPMLFRLFPRALRRGALPFYIRAIADALRRVPSIFAERRPITRAHLRLMRRLGVTIH